MSQCQEIGSLPLLECELEVTMLLMQESISVLVRSCVIRHESKEKWMRYPLCDSLLMQKQLSRDRVGCIPNWAVKLTDISRARRGPEFHLGQVVLRWTSH